MGCYWWLNEDSYSRAKMFINISANSVKETWEYMYHSVKCHFWKVILHGVRSEMTIKVELQSHPGTFQKYFRRKALFLTYNCNSNSFQTHSHEQAFLQRRNHNETRKKLLNDVYQ